MSKTTVVAAALSLAALFAVVSCSKEGGESPAPAPQAAGAEAAGPGQKDEGGHAQAGAVPGSHEDWCGEHQVPESQCTRCNPDLIAAFKATGDWCEEHGLPESQCLKCNPELKIVRPPPRAEAR
jgi:hypothetical protein